jgi:microcystin-dependent protein
MIDTAIRDNTFESGTTMVFYQSSPPNGWHLVTTDTDINGNKTSVNDTLLRVMQNNESGGTVRGDIYASNVFNHDHPHTLKVNGNTNGHHLSINEMPSHSHTETNTSINATGGTAIVYDYGHNSHWMNHWFNYNFFQQVATSTSTNRFSQTAVGGGGSHYHSLSNVGLTGSISNSVISPKYSNMILCRRD